MEHSADIERPAKRFKSSGSFGRALADPIYSPAQSHFSPPDDTLILPRPWSPAGSSVLHSSFACTDTTLDHSSSSGSSPGELHPLSLARPFTNGVLRDMDGYAPPVIPPDYARAVDTSSNSTSPTPECQDLGCVNRSESPSPRLHHGNGAHHTPRGRSVSLELIELPQGKVKGVLRTPFGDCLNTWGTFELHHFRKPDIGFVDSYIKVKWTEKQGLLSHSSLLQAAEAKKPKIPNWYNALLFPKLSSIPSSSEPLDITVARRRESPRLVPDQFGFGAKMEIKDRRLWDFYIRNWCPGRSILQKSNLWLNEFGSMQQSDGVRAAIQCLAATYIYDYSPSPELAEQINGLFSLSEKRLTELLNYFTHKPILNERESNELVAIAAMLSMQDIVVFERRMKGNHPRWWVGFSQAAHCLKSSDTGQRWWDRTNMQISSLRIAQSIVVCRAIIISQPMMELTKPQDFIPENEAHRYDWLLDDTKQGMVEIQGGCGFSKRLLLIFNFITYFSAVLRQDPRNFGAPVAIDHELTRLRKLKQWSREATSYERAIESPQHIEWIRELPEGSLIRDRPTMTTVTAECWRIAAILYLQCRAQRLPRNHKEVIANMDDLMSCIRIMPTSGSIFTAQAPLFPVFLLGILATEPRHKILSRKWFESVTRTPVRSSVPPLFEALERIWGWIERDIPLRNDEKLRSHIGDRDPWWEHLVARVQEEEKEILCLT